MKRSVGLAVFYCFSLVCFSQGGGQMKGVTRNVSSFSAPGTKNITPELIQLTASAFREHPDFGILPEDSPCSDCIELLEKRTLKSRYYVKNGSNGKEFFCQAGYENLNYKDEKGWMRAMNPDLKASSLPGVYETKNLAEPKTLNMNTGSTSIELPDLKLVFNLHTSVSQLVDNTVIHLFGNSNLSNSSAGTNGSFTSDAWHGIDREILFDVNSIETNFILTRRPSLPSFSGWLAFCDEVTLPNEYTIIKDSVGAAGIEGCFRGSLVVVKLASGEVARWNPITVFDNNQSSPEYSDGAYQLIKNGNVYTIRTLVDVSWLLDSSRVYPVTVDPLVSGNATWNAGNIGFTAYTAGDGFCGSSTTPCVGGALNVTLPGQCTATNAIWGASYHANAGRQRRFGGFRMVGPCGEDPVSMDNWYSCNVNTSGDCIGSGFNAPWLVTCLNPSCAATVVPFQIKTIDCGYGSAACSTTNFFITNSTWTVSVQGHTLEVLGNSSGSGSSSITGSCSINSTLNPAALYGVPAYTYFWSPGSATTNTLTVNQSSNGTYSYTSTVTDACGVAQTATFTFTIADCPLPIELLNFDALYNGKSVDTKWSTATETNNNYFTIERTTDGINYSLIGLVPSSAPGGNSTTLLSYFLNDANVKTGTYYYRLKQTDFNGMFQYSNVVPVTIADESNAFSVVPNPANNSTDIFYQVYDDAPSLLKILDAQGKLVYSERIENVRGKRKHTINLSKFSNGLYFIRMATNAKIYSVKLVKQ